jgi:hypothetical protein
VFHRHLLDTKIGAHRVFPGTDQELYPTSSQEVQFLSPVCLKSQVRVFKREMDVSTDQPHGGRMLKPAPTLHPMQDHPMLSLEVR